MCQLCLIYLWISISTLEIVGTARKHDDTNSEHDGSKPEHVVSSPEHDDNGLKHDRIEPKHDDNKPNHDGRKLNHDCRNLDLDRIKIGKYTPLRRACLDASRMKDNSKVTTHDYLS